MQRYARYLVVLLIFVCIGTSVPADNSQPVSQYNVHWRTPSVNSSGSMPLGNGDIGLNVWVEEGGDLLFYISKTDAWSENAQLLKLGRIRISMTPNPFETGLGFRQSLQLENGEIQIETIAEAADGNSAKRRGLPLLIKIRVDANHPVIQVDLLSTAIPSSLPGEKNEFDAQVKLEVWRTQERVMDGAELSSVRGMMGSPDPITMYPDTILENDPNRVVWYHRNQHSIWPLTLRHQGLEPLLDRFTDPLMDRTFGGALECEGMEKIDATTFRSTEPRDSYRIRIYPLTKQTETVDEWQNELNETIESYRSLDPNQTAREHLAWWREFWNRSYVRVSGENPIIPIDPTTIPLRIGASSTGDDRFLGEIRQATVFNRALNDSEMSLLFSGQNVESPVGDWHFVNLKESVCANQAGDGLPATSVKDVKPIGADGVRLDGDGWLEVADDPSLQFRAGCTLSAWIRPEQLPAGGARIVDKTVSGTSTGYLLDTYPGNSLRLITAAGSLSYPAQLKPGEWVHVAGSYDAATGVQQLFINGECVATQQGGVDLFTVSQGYALQRFVSACSARGEYAIKFNGSIFTVEPYDIDPKLGPDFRQWGGCYWFQNTRLPYWPMLGSGDFDLMQSLFNMYVRMLPLAKERNQLWFGTDGAFFPETLYFWGTFSNTDYGWDRKGLPSSKVVNDYIGVYWQAGLELSAMMLDYYLYTGDDAFAREKMIPVADALVTFFDKRFPRHEDGTLKIYPAQAVETWWDVVNPLPEVAGLHWVIEGLLDLPENLTTDEQRAAWKQVQKILPKIPLETKDGGTCLSPAELILGGKHNMENPELYAIFPYRFYGLTKPDLDVAIRSFEKRLHPNYRGWGQCPIQAALLGLTEQVKPENHFIAKHAGSRFPAFWGPNFDWIPDQTHGGVACMALQSMIVQPDGNKILVLPAWPKEWDVDFKLSAPKNTVVEGVFKEGKLKSLKVTPESRRADVVVFDPK